MVQSLLGLETARTSLGCLRGTSKGPRLLGFLDLQLPHFSTLFYTLPRTSSSLCIPLHASAHRAFLVDHAPGAPGHTRGEDHSHAPSHTRFGMQLHPRTGAGRVTTAGALSSFLGGSHTLSPVVEPRTPREPTLAKSPSFPSRLAPCHPRLLRPSARVDSNHHKSPARPRQALPASLSALSYLTVHPARCTLRLFAWRCRSPLGWFYVVPE